MMPRILTVASLAAAALVFAAAASAAPSPSYQVVGVDAGAQQGTVSTFLGLATGSTGDRGLWQASLSHDPLDACSTLGSACAVTGGTFSLRTNNGSELAGSFTAGAITLTAQAAGCGAQQFAVYGSVSTDAGPQDFLGTLTNHRVGARDQCRTVVATLQATLVQSIGTF